MKSNFKPNCICHFCLTPIYRDLDTQRKSKSGFFYCNRECKSRGQKLYNMQQMYNIPKTNPIFQTIIDIYKLQRGQEILTSIYVNKMMGTHLAKYRPYLVSASARVKGVPNFSKTPQDMDKIMDTFKFNKIEINDFENLPEIKDRLEQGIDWEVIVIQNWSDEDITYQIR